ncbi:oxidoreductase [Sinorhizobium sp. RAC02]|uniref:oxidoreductase n=1 Tax=Sinorhizobium sp. RAC02 TaxID=1842534 RepID=UPI0012376501|nr:oxidoreductase [Sinorhizobium sp. RAC02]
MATTDRVAGTKPWTLSGMPEQAGRFAVVTGANSGLGFLTARELVRKGARVLMTARDEGRGQLALARIRAELPDAAVELRRLDLADLDDVSGFADTVLADGRPLDLLINNAGVMMPPHGLTRQGHETQFGVNHLAHFALTLRLLPLLSASSNARVVTVSSELHRRGRIHFEDLTGEKNYGRMAFYAQSKFANALFALELDRRVKAAGLSIISLLAHPGYSDTNLQTNATSGVLRLFMRIGNRFLAQNAEQGVLNQLYAATAAGLFGGEFIGPDGFREMRGSPSLVHPLPAATDPELAARFWRLSEDLTHLTFPARPERVQ